MEKDRAELLRRRIALYRSYLREGVEGALALEYLRQIAEDGAELNQIEAGEATLTGGRAGLARG
jgi:hypothetical protein